MKEAKHKYLRLLPAIYFMLLGIFFIVMELLHSGFSLYWFCIYAALFLPVLIPIRPVWTLFGLIVSFIFSFLLLNQLGWLVQYLNGAYFKYPFDTFVVGFPFIIGTLLCGMALGYMGLASGENKLFRLRRS